MAMKQKLPDITVLERGIALVTRGHGYSMGIFSGIGKEGKTSPLWKENSAWNPDHRKRPGGPHRKKTVQETASRKRKRQKSKSLMSRTSGRSIDRLDITVAT